MWKLFCAFVAVLVPLTVACGFGAEVAPTPAPNARPVHVLHIWDDYQQNEPRANKEWKKRWIYLEMPVDVVENEGAVFYLTGYPFALSERALMRFTDEERLIEIEPGQQLYATCRLSGLILGYLLSFRDCQ